VRGRHHDWRSRVPPRPTGNQAGLQERSRQRVRPAHRRRRRRLLLPSPRRGIRRAPGSLVRIFRRSDRVVAAAKGKWSTATTIASDPRLRRFSLQPRCSAVVLGGVIHWLMHQRLFGADRVFILTYDVRTATAAAIELLTGEQSSCPPAAVSNLHLTSSPDAKLSLLVADKFRISHISLAAAARRRWLVTQHAVINTKATVRISVVAWHAAGMVA
jgi:hypothetical protein